MKLLPVLSETRYRAAEIKLASWANMLPDDKVVHDDAADQHLIFLNGGNVPNEYSQVVGFTVYETEDATAVFTQAGPMCVLGFIRSEIPAFWQGGRYLLLEVNSQFGLKPCRHPFLDGWKNIFQTLPPLGRNYSLKRAVAVGG